jgi:hypothetical protein
MTYMYSGLVVWRQAAASFWSVCAALPRKRLSAARHNTNSVHDLHLKCLRRRSPNVRVKREAAAWRLAREAHDDSERFAGQVLCR